MTCSRCHSLTPPVRLRGTTERTFRDRTGV